MTVMSLQIILGDSGGKS